jgi:hypothetical protein
VKRLATAAVLALSLAGCGSTVQVSSTGTVAPDGLGNSTTLDGTAGTAPGGLSSAPGGSALSVGASGSRQSVSGAPRSSTAGSATGSVGTSKGSATAAGSRTPVRVGVLYGTGVDQAANAIGISGLTTGDTKAQAAAVFAWVNAHGGLGGHPLVPVYYAISATDSSNNPDAAYQAACTSLAQDGKVRFVVTILNLRPVSLPCFSKYGIGLLDDESGVSDATMAKYATYLAGPGDFAPGRMLKNLVDDLWSRGWLTSASKVGSFTYDTPDNVALVEGPLTRALAAHGLKIASKQRVSNDSSSISQASSASLQFRAAGVDRVIPVTASPLFVMNAASSQNYHPAYALYSSFGPGALLEGAAPKDQLANAAGIGWQPFLDIGAGTHPGPVSSNETLCFSLMKAAGQASSSATVKGFQAQVCNTVFYLKAMIDRLPGVPADLFTAARPLLGSSFLSADTFRTDVTHRVDGAGGFRDLTYDQRCSCFQYTSPIKDAS